MTSVTNLTNLYDDLTLALADADVFIGVSVANVLTPEMIQLMNPDPIIFGLANPVPEIMPEIVIKVGAAVIGTARSDFPK